MCLSCGVEINVYDVSSLIMEGRGLREPCLAVLWEEAHLQACRGAPAFSCGAAVKQICTIALMTHVLWCSFPHSPYTSMDCYFLLLFLLSIYYPKFKSAVVSLCCFLLRDCSTSLFFGSSFASMAVAIALSPIGQSIRFYHSRTFSAFLSTDFCPLRQLTYARKPSAGQDFSHPSLF